MFSCIQCDAVSTYIFLCFFSLSFFFFVLHLNIFLRWNHDQIGSELDGSDDEFDNGNERSCSCVIM